MNDKLLQILQLVEQSSHLGEEEKKAIVEAVNDTDRQQSATEFELARMEQVNHTTSVLLEETIAELEQKRKAVEAQNRELEIEAALENIRNQSLAMHHSDELKDVVDVMFKKLDELKVLHGTVAIQLFDFNSKDSFFWPGNTLNEEPPLIRLPFDEKIMNEDTCHRDLWRAMTAGEVIVNKVYSRKQKDRWFDYVFANNDLATIPLDSRQFILQAETHTVCFIPKKNSAVFADSWDGSLYSEDELNVLKRSAKVFEQAYIRFLDLQKAEAQAREAQIEAAMERIRSRSLAMHKSDDLQEVVNSVFARLKELNVELDTANIIIFTEGSKDMEYWTANIHSQTYVSHFLIPYINNACLDDLLLAKESGLDLSAHTYSVKEKNELFNYLFEYSDFKNISEDRKHFILESERFTTSVAYIKNIGIQINSYSKPAFSEDENEILKRFTRVFEQAYVRFLDLQKAEAQAREAEIELALERVRARTMAMQKSDELPDTSYLVFQQFENLGTKAEHFSIGIINEAEEVGEMYATIRGDKLLQQRKISIHDPIAFNKVYTAWKSKKRNLVLEITGNELKTYNIYRNNIIGRKLFSENPNAGDRWIILCAFFSRGLLSFASSEPAPEEILPLLERFAKVFDQTYTRFLDLQKAEAQAREAQIEASLERVRSKTMAMHKSEELIEVIATVFQQLLQLNFKIDSVNLCLNYKENPFKYWMAIPGKPYPEEITVPYTDITFMNHVIQESKTNNGLIRFVFNKPEKDEWIKHSIQHTITKNATDERKKFMLDAPGIASSVATIKSIAVGVSNFAMIPYTEEENEILKRFANVFSQSYTRFLDLQKAEAQAREAQIEAALEKVRSRSLAMHKSDELQDVVHTVLERLKELKVDFYTVIIVIFQQDSTDIFWWLENKEQQQYPKILLQYSNNPYLRDLFEARENDKELLSKCYSFEEKNELFHYLFSDTDFKHVPENQKKFLLDSEFATISVAVAKKTGIQITSYSRKSFTEQEHDILKRFAKVFDQAHTRFLDLQKAEAQAREAQIEAALERVRSRTTGMQKSEELREVIQMVFEQLRQLGFNIDSAHFNLNYKESDDYNLWSAAPGQPYPVETHIPYFDHPVFIKAREAKERGLDFFTENYTQDEKNKFFEHLFKHVQVIPEERRKYILNGKGVAASTVLMNTISLWVMNYAGIPYSEAENAILKRFGKIFEQSHTRFLDLQKAEAQARETEIELALERVRAKTMAMQHQNDLLNVTDLFAEQLIHLGFDLDVVNFSNGLSYGDWDLWITAPAGESTRATERVVIPWIDHPYFQKTRIGLDNFKKGIDLNVAVFNKEEKDSFLDHLLLSDSIFKKLPQESKDYLYGKPGFSMSTIFLKDTWVTVCKYDTQPFTDEQHVILRRFANAFGQAYIRFLDLKNAEAQAREVIKRASVDRVRAEIASMRTTKDLERITPLIWNELTTLGVPFIRCGVFIMDEEQQQIETHLSTPGGEAIATFNLPYNSPGETARILTHWHKKELYKQHWNEAQFIEFTQNLAQQGAITSGKKYITENHPTDLYLHFLPFLQGMLYAGNTSPLNEDELQLMQNLADAFSTAYARYEDFNKLEAAKKQVDNALNILQATQKQLIQSEKMASLGELTAGIAHEIQNPLNFVNNFSDVNKELIDELKSERQKAEGERNTGLEDDILGDIVQNLEKINYHGKRAEAIVKGMLQHSRTSTRVKEPTDINRLADEYLRLSYHGGLRAKDKSFNADFKMELDDSIGRINIIPQDIGRVLLNLFNNAFYAVNEKKKIESSQYVPAVTVVTKRLGEKIEIIVTDNGPGIPQNIVDKIFQPFFTTKPTGQGTGLGLSLAYDIIKAHGGEIKVESKEGEGTTFSVQLPVG